MRKLVLTGGALLAVFAFYVLLRGINQQRADYEGNLTFIGDPVNLLGTRYHRVAHWRATGDTSPLPPVTVHIDGTPFELPELTTELVTSLGGTLMNGGLKDKSGAIMRYRFEQNRLTWFSLDAPNPRLNQGPDPNARITQLAMSLNDGSPFTLPISRRNLIRACGKPLRSYWNFAQ